MVVIKNSLELYRSKNNSWELIGILKGEKGDPPTLADLNITVSSQEINNMEGITYNIQNKFSQIDSDVATLQNNLDGDVATLQNNLDSDVAKLQNNLDREV